MYMRPSMPNVAVCGDHLPSSQIPGTRATTRAPRPRSPAAPAPPPAQPPPCWGTPKGQEMEGNLEEMLEMSEMSLYLFVIKLEGSAMVIYMGSRWDLYIFICYLCICLVFESLRDENRLHPENRIERERSGRTWPNQSRLGSNMAVLGLRLGRTGAHLKLAPNSGQLAPTWGPTGVQLGATWAHLDASCALRAEVGRKTGPMWATWPCTNPQENIGNSSKHASFQRAALSPQN